MINIIADELLDQVITQLDQNYLVPLIGANMSGKTTLIKELRRYITKMPDKKNACTLQIDAPQNRINFSSYNENTLEIRIDDVSYILEKINKNLADIDECYSEVISKINESVKSFDSEVSVSYKNADNKQKVRNIERHIKRIAKIKANVKDESEINSQNLTLFIEKTQGYIEKCAQECGLVENQNNYNQKILFINYRGEEKKLTQVSSGLEILILLLFVVELIEYLVTKENIEFFLLIDEPESYLHPSWQKEFLSYLLLKKNAKFKILYATHSQYLIPIQHCDLINIVTIDNNGQLLCKSLKDLVGNIEPSRDREINILQPVEDALGFNADNFSLPFVTVEGEEEFKLLQTQYPEKLKVVKIINLKGASNVLPYILAALKYQEKFKGVFLLDADLKLDSFIKNVEDKDSVIDKIKDKFLFLGKEIYDFDMVYEKTNGSYELKRNMNECLEDFIASHFFDSQAIGYQRLANIAKEIINSNIPTEDDKEEILICLDKFRDYRFKVIVSCIKQKRGDKDLQDKIEQELKTTILNVILQDDLSKLTPLIQKLNEKFENF